ncbi:MAG: hypothetical protein ACI90V_003386 [Bacillariaceae sp.]|jgi:hypothetical protein
MNQRPRMRMRRSIRNKDGLTNEKRLIDMFLSCFSSSDDFESRDELLKPLYYIVDACSSEQMEATAVDSVDDASKKESEKVDDESCKRTQLRRVNVLRSRLSSFLLCDLRRFRDNETPSLQIESTTSMDEIDTDDRWESRISDSTKQAIFDTILHSAKRGSLGIRFKCRRIKKMRIPFLCPFRDYNRVDSLSPSFSVSHYDNTTQLEKELESVYSDDVLSCHKYTVLGTSFPHPVYTRRCRLLHGGVNRGAVTDLWTEMETNYSLEGDNFTLPPMKTVVETVTAKSWGSNASSSHYPTDEQSSDGDSFDCSFDSDAEIPFDEIFSDKHKTRFESIKVQTQELSRTADYSYQKSPYSFDDELSSGSLPWSGRSSSHNFDEPQKLFLSC